MRTGFNSEREESHLIPSLTGRNLNLSGNSFRWKKGKGVFLRLLNWNSTCGCMNPVVRRNHENRSTLSDGLRSTLKWLRSRILFIIREWTHGSKPIAARDFDWRQIVNLNQLQLIAQCAVTLFCFSPSSFSFFKSRFN